MAPPGRPEDTRNEMEYAVERYRRDGRDLVQTNGRLYDYPEQRASWNNHGQGNGPPQVYPEKKAHHISHRAHQNAAAIMDHSKLEKGKVREGKHAAAVAQIHQNDLHNIDTIRELPPHTENGAVTNGLAPAKADRSKNYIKQQLNLQSKFSNAQNSGSAKHQNGVGHNSDLNTSFDPMKDRHMWTMWRTAVNGRIVDEVRHLERIKGDRRLPRQQNHEPNASGVYGRALVVPPLKRFIRVDDESRAIAYQMSNLGKGSLETSQFVYYGLPRVNVWSNRQ